MPAKPAPVAKSRASAHDLIRRCTKDSLSTRPEYYSGRGPNEGDLNSNHLKDLHRGIKVELGDAAAKAFVSMVEVLADMSATAFLNSLYRLESNGWRFDASLFNGSGDGIAHDGMRDGGVSAMCSIFATLGRDSDPERDRWRSDSIKAAFLRSVGSKVRQVGGFGYPYYGNGIACRMEESR